MKIGLLGCGTVGKGVYDIVANRSDMEIKYVLVRRNREEFGTAQTMDINTIINDSEVDTVIEVMGGLSPAYEYVKAALEAGKNVVTANKHLVAHYYKELIELADEKGVAFRCTAAVGGGIPWLVNLERTLRVNPVKSLAGIMNGTTNYILDSMHKNHADFNEVLKKAQELGYAEADPSADIDGLDVQRKCLISANVAFGTLLNENDVPVFGIRNIKNEDIAEAEKHGKICKLLGRASIDDGKVSAYVEPVFVDKSKLEAAVSDNFNAISFEGEYTGKESFYGQGAGRYPTAYNVVEDLYDVSTGVKCFYTEKFEEKHSDNSNVKNVYYMRSAIESEELNSLFAESWGNGFITKPISVMDAHIIATKMLEKDSSFFMASID